jgi:hypothetical protein
VATRQRKCHERGRNGSVREVASDKLEPAGTMRSALLAISPRCECPRRGMRGLVLIRAVQRPLSMIAKQFGAAVKSDTQCGGGIDQRLEYECKVPC